MARKPRIEVEGGLYHVITRGNNRRLIFDDDDDYQKLLRLLATQKAKLPFFLYAYCLMPNHVHLLMQRREARIGKVMHRLLTGYSRYYNRRNARVGHLFQDRYKGILCQSDSYLAELVRYIHLNPVRAKLVNDPAAYKYSSHRAYLGLDKGKLADVDLVLRHFGATKKLARERFDEFVRAKMNLSRCKEYYPDGEDRILGSDEFVEEVKSHEGLSKRRTETTVEARTASDVDSLVEAASRATGLTANELCSGMKYPTVIRGKEALIIVGLEAGISNSSLAKLLGVHSSAVSRRADAGRVKLKKSTKFRELVQEIRKLMDKSEQG